MHIVAQRVVSSAGVQGINTFVYRDGIAPWPADPMPLLDGESGALVFQAVEAPPGGNAVRSYLDLALPDSVSSDVVRWILPTLLHRVQPDRLPVTGRAGSAAFRLGMDAGLALLWREELTGLAIHACTCVLSYLTSEPRPTPAAPPGDLTELERQLVVDAARRSDSAAVLGLLWDLAAADRLEAMVEGIDVHVANCEASRAVMRSFLVDHLPGILVNYYFPTLGIAKFNAFIEWSLVHPEWAEQVRDGAAQSSGALRQAVRRATPK